jgi:hypothetical protein
MDFGTKEHKLYAIKINEIFKMQLCSKWSLAAREKQ